MVYRGTSIQLHATDRRTAQYVERPYELLLVEEHVEVERRLRSQENKPERCTEWLVREWERGRGGVEGGDLPPTWVFHKLQHWPGAAEVEHQKPPHLRTLPSVAAVAQRGEGPSGGQRAPATSWKPSPALAVAAASVQVASRRGRRCRPSRAPRRPTGAAQQNGLPRQHTKLLSRTAALQRSPCSRTASRSAAPSRTCTAPSLRPHHRGAASRAGAPRRRTSRAAVRM